MVTAKFPAAHLPVMLKPVMVRVWADGAAFNRPEFQTERVSYLVPTPAAVRAVLEAIYWKPQFHWRVREIRVLREPNLLSETRNEVSGVVTRNSLKRPVIVEEARLQRATVRLTDVDYVVVAEAIPNEFSMDEMIRHTDIFNHRLAVGQCYRRPYLGCREWSADFAPPDGSERAINWTMDLGRMHFDFDRRTNPPTPVWFEPRIENGVVRVPDELYALGGSTGGLNAYGSQLPSGQ